MASQQLDEEEIFHVAKSIPEPECRRKYLDQICAGDQALRERVEALLAVHEQEQGFLKSADSEPAPTVDQRPITEAAGQEIGRYKLLQKIGEGGFGVVFMAEQVRPVRRKVALKVIKPGMDSSAVVARFEAERQALAMMDHPNIARVLDGGTTDTGRPYFVMELVKGVPLTEYCDKNQLNTHARLQLFATVCRAIQHAHQKGIIHRDLKPSNILVTLHDGKPMIKVIDFGVAKAINQQLTEKTLFTAFGQMVGTPQYMSPEQAEMSGLDVDTRSDIYSLGVILYELLTGSTPLEAERLRTAGYVEMQRLIREEEPPKPSTRLSGSGERLTVIANHRSLSPEQLQRSVRGDLDWIVMKSLEKDRARRYDTPSALADEVGRYLGNEPVQACPPSAGYRLRKYFYRNRMLVTSTAMVVAILCAATVISVSLAAQRSQALVHAQQEARKASEANEKLSETLAELSATSNNLANALIDRAVSDALEGNFQLVELSLEQAEEVKADFALVESIRGLARFYSGDNEAIESLRELTHIYPDRIEAWSALYQTTFSSGRYDLATTAYTKLIELEPQTTWETFFKVLTEVYAHPEEAAQTLEMLLKGQPNSAILLCLHALTLNETGRKRRSSLILNECLNEFERANSLMPNSRFIQTVYLEAIANAIQIEQYVAATTHSGTDSISHWKEQAELLVRSLTDGDNLGKSSRIARASYFNAIGDEVRYDRIVSDSRASDDRYWVKASTLYGRSKLKEMRTAMDSEVSWGKYIFRAYADLEEAESDASRSVIAQDAFDKVYSGSEYWLQDHLLALEVFLVAGDLDGLKKNASQLLDTRKNGGDWSIFLDTLELYANPSIRNVEKYLSLVIPGTEEACVAYHAAGLIAFANGDHVTARERFKKSTETGKFDWWSHVWSEAFLNRLAPGSSWGSWTLKQVP